MKINKILAAGVAATLAVTSLSAVAGAEVQTKTFDVYRTKAEFWGHSIKFNADVNKNIASRLRQAATKTVVLNDLTNYVTDVLGWQGFLTYLYDNGEADKAAEYLKAGQWSGYNNFGCALWITGVNLTATGYQHLGDTATVTKTFSFTNKDNAGNTIPWTLTVLDDGQPIYHDGEFASYFYDEITSLQLEVVIGGSTLCEDEYNYWSYISNAGDNSRRYLDIGDILVNGTKANIATGTYTYGAKSETSNEDDLNNILAEQAKATTDSWVEGTNDNTVGMGYLVGTPAKDGAYPRAASETQNLYEATGTKGLLFAAGADTIDETKATFAVSDLDATAAAVTATADLT